MTVALWPILTLSFHLVFWSLALGCFALMLIVRSYRLSNIWAAIGCGLVTLWAVITMVLR